MASIATRVSKLCEGSRGVVSRWSRHYSDVDAKRGVGPISGPENDPATRGDIPDDRRASHVHSMEPKDVTKQKVAQAQEEPDAFQGSKLMPGFDAPVSKEAQPQSETIDEKLKGR